jgi:hypothetical protein
MMMDSIPFLIIARENGPKLPTIFHVRMVSIVMYNAAKNSPIDK